MAALWWAVGKCGSHAKFVLKTDDDSFNVPERYIDYLLNNAVAAIADSDADFVGGQCASGEEPHREASHVWHVPAEHYPGHVLPMHCKVE